MDFESQHLVLLLFSVHLLVSRCFFCCQIDVSHSKSYTGFFFFLSDDERAYAFTRRAIMLDCKSKDIKGTFVRGVGRTSVSSLAKKAPYFVIMVFFFFSADFPLPSSFLIYSFFFFFSLAGTRRTRARSSEGFCFRSPQRFFFFVVVVASYR